MVVMAEVGDKCPPSHIIFPERIENPISWCEMMIASGDSYNDLGMIKASKAGFLFRTTEQIKKDNPDVKAVETYDELMTAIKEVMA